MAVRVLDEIIKVGFACIIAGVLIPEVGGSPGLSLAISLTGFVLVAAAGFWRARTVGRERQERLPPPIPVPGIPASGSGGGPGKLDRLRDVGLLSFLFGLFALLVSFAALFTGPPQPRLVTAGGILTAIGAGALAMRYRFFACLVACFLAPIAFIVGFVAWPPMILAFLGLLLVWLLRRLWRRQPRPVSDA